MEELLKQLGFVVNEENKAKVEAAKKYLGENFVPKHRFDEKLEEAKKATEAVAERDKQINSLKKFEGDKTQLEARIKELQETNTANETKYNASLKEEKVRNAVKREFFGKVHDEAVVLNLIDLTKVEIDENGNIKSGFKEQFDTLKKDKTFLFVPEDNKNPKDFRPAGKTPGSGDKDDEGTAVAFAKSLAAGAKGGQDVASRGAAYYFGTPEVKK